MSKKTICPVCSSKSVTDLYNIAVPVLQNKVFNKKEDATISPKGDICLTSCSNCGFAFNSTFDNSILVYDTDYDNSVPSNLFVQYYHSIAEYLYKKYNLKDGVLYDVGCGKGTFLKILCEKYPDVKAIGIDPSYEGELQYAPNLLFIQDFFEAKYAEEKPSLVISRHVFEHIEQPVDFLKIIADALKKYTNVPFYIEVPDLTWIVKNEAFWDICYEHCNYFSPAALQTMVKLANAEFDKVTPGFNDQYLWCEGILNSTKQFEAVEGKKHTDFIASLSKFTSGISSLKSNSATMLKEYKEKGYKTVIWGMATKGVEYCNIIDAGNTMIDYCIDVNTNKQNKFIPFTGHKIQSPDILINVKGDLLVIIMNTNYQSEIKQFISDNKLAALFLNGHGEKI
jgi:SAM-dependent methyltransferase